MRLVSLGSLAAAALAAGTVAAAADTLIITEQDAPRVREYIVEESAPVTVDDVTVEVGATLPETIEVRRFDDRFDSYRDYSYAVVNDREVIVEPSSRRIIQVLD